MKEELNKLEQERKELNTLINKGVSFEIKDIEFETHKRFFGLIKKRVPKEVTRTFTIEETTLSTLDRLSSEWIEFAIDEALMKSMDGMKKARGLAKEHAIRCARIVAIAVLGENRLIPRSHKGGTRWVEDVQAIEDLTALFARKIKPSRLYQLCVLVNAMCNLGDFLNSIRLMQPERTTMPNRIEENNEG
jgi:hypothetical protein